MDFRKIHSAFGCRIQFTTSPKIFTICFVSGGFDECPTKREPDGGKSAKILWSCVAVVFPSTRRWLRKPLGILIARNGVEMIYYAETSIGCSIGEAKNLAHARNKVQAEIGTLQSVRKVEKATIDNIAWVAGMGGYLPKAAQQSVQATSARVAQK